MKSKHAFYTKNLAGLYEKQGYYEDSVKGFKALLQAEPERKDFVRDLAAAEEKLRHHKKQKLMGLVAEWVSLLRKPSL